MRGWSDGSSKLKAFIRAAASVAVVALAGAVAAAGTHGHKPPEQLGKVSFANSCKPEVQAGFTRGVALLHSFWFQEAATAFRQVLEQDPGCAIATWGLATSVIGNPFAAGPTPAAAKQAGEALARGRAIGAGTERERFFIEAVGAYFDGDENRPHGQRLKALTDAFGDVAKRFPADDEAQIFHALYLISIQQSTDERLTAAIQATTTLEDQFKKHPGHPGVAHYLIHGYDFPSLAERGLPAARRYAEIAPSAPHALHMPSHIFTRVGAWADSAATNERSAAAAKAENLPGDQLHALDYLMYAYLQLARDGDAARVLEEVRRVRDSDPSVRYGTFVLATARVRYTLERGAWKEAAQLEPHADRDAITYFARAIGAARSGAPAAADIDAQQLARIVEAMKAGKEAHGPVQVQRLAAGAWIAFAEGDRDRGIKLMREAADLEDQGEKGVLTSGRALSARELLGDMLLEAGRPAEALAEYELSQAHDPNRYRSLYGAGQAAAQAGDRGKARHYFSKLNELAGSGNRRPEMELVRRYLASN